MKRSYLLSITCTVAFAAGWAVACVDPQPNPKHCFEALGDATCVERYGPDRPYCTGCGEEVQGTFGCVAELPEDTSCYSPCGGRTFAEDDDSCLVSGDETDADGDDDGPIACEGPDDCPTDQPICEEATGECVGCDETASPDETCAALDEMTPVCADSRCVACSADNPGICADESRVCDASQNTCVPCTEHTQCDLDGEVGVCQLETGSCFPMAERVFVDGSASQCPTGDGSAESPYCEIEDALASTEALELAIVLVPDVYVGNLEIDRTVAIVADRNSELYEQGQRPSVVGSPATERAFSISNDGELFVKDLIMLSDTDAVVLSGLQANLWVDDSIVSSTLESGIRFGAGDVRVRRSVFAGGNQGIESNSGGRLWVTNSVFFEHADYGLDLVNVDADILYSTVVLAPDGIAGIRCSLIKLGSSIRNSLVLTADDAPQFNCPGIERVATPVEAALPNFDPSWFATEPPFGLVDGQFPNELSLEGVWRDGDPPTDIDGDPRPTEDGSPDFIGADRVP